LFIPIFAALAFLPTIARAQVQTGQINGVVKDETGGALPGVTITTKNLANGQVRTVESGTNGLFQVVALQPGQYSVTAELAGFGTVTRSDITVNVGSAIDVDIAMKIANLTETLTVTSEAPIVQSTKTDLSEVITQQAMENLPSRQKQYLDFTLLMPATTQSVSTVQGTGAVIGGARSKEGALLVDGFYNFDEGFNMPKQRQSQDAIQEFQVIQFGGAAEYGRAIGGIINAVTKSGTNSTGGSGYGFFRNNSLNAQPFESEFLGVPKTDYNRYQEGGTLGGPIVENRVFYFASYEKVNETWPYANGITPANAALIGLIPSDTTSPRYFRSSFALGKIDYNLNGGQRLTTSLSYTNQHDREMCCLQTLTTGSAAYELYANDFAGSVNWTSVSASGHRMQDAKLSYFPRYYGTAGDLAGGPPLVPQGQINTSLESNSSAPSVSIGGVATFGSVSLNNRINTFPVEAIYTSSMFVNRHTVKFGADYYYAYYDYNQYNPLHGSYTFSSVANFQKGLYTQYTQSFGAIANPRAHQWLSGFIQDQFRASDRVTYNYGLRYDLEINPKQEFSGVAWGNVYHNVGPRGAASIDLTGDGHTFLKLSSGLFFDRIWNNATNNFYALEGYQTRASYTWTPTSPGAPAYPAVFATAPANLPKTLNNVIIVPSDARDPMSAQAVATLEHALTTNLSVSVSGVYTRSWWKEYNVDTNLVWNGSAFIRPNSNYRQITQTVYGAPAEFTGGFVEIKKRGVKFGADANFTASKALQAGTGFANDPRVGIMADYGPVPDVPRWRVVGTGWYNLTPDMQVSINFQDQDGIAINPVAAGQDLLGTGVTGTRTPGLGPFAFRAPSRNSFDGRFTWQLPVGLKQRLRLSAEVYNLFNHQNVIGVNNNYGPNEATPNAVWLTPTAYAPPREIQLGVRFQF
jgi:hypothetical protein